MCMVSCHLQYKSARRIYEDTAKYWACMYAGRPKEGFDFQGMNSKVQQMSEMGIDKVRECFIRVATCKDLFHCESRRGASWGEGSTMSDKVFPVA